MCNQSRCRLGPEWIFGENLEADGRERQCSGMQGASHVNHVDNEKSGESIPRRGSRLTHQKAIPWTRRKNMQKRECHPICQS